LIENNGPLGTTLSENGPTLFENSPKTSGLDHINANSWLKRDSRWFDGPPPTQKRADRIVGRAEQLPYLEQHTGRIIHAFLTVQFRKIAHRNQLAHLLTLSRFNAETLQRQGRPEQKNVLKGETPSKISDRQSPILRSVITACLRSSAPWYLSV
jgi:hypothetical protein